jgi:hypothetical protein
MTSPERHALSEEKKETALTLAREKEATRKEAAETQRIWQEIQNQLNRDARAADRAADREARSADRAAAAADRAAMREAAAADRKAGTHDKVGARIYDDFMKNTKGEQTILNGHKQLQAIAADPSAAGDISLIFSYMRMLDPLSVVREGEFATAQNAASVPDRVRNAYNKALKGERLNPDQRKDFINTAGKLADTASKRIVEVRGDLAKQGKSAGMNDETINAYLPQLATPAAGKPTVVRTGTRNGVRVEQLSDGTIREVR